MKEICDCGDNTLLSRPIKYSIDKFSVYRRKAKLKDYIKRELL